MSLNEDRGAEIPSEIFTLDEQTFKKIYHDLSPSIFSAAMIYVKDEDLAKEILQITFIKFWEKRRSFDDIISLENYLFTMARNLIFDHFRNLVRENKLLTALQTKLSTYVDDTDQRLITKEYEDLLHTTIEKLPPQQRKVYVLNKQQGLNYDEIADQMHISRNTVKKHLELANKFIRETLGSELSSYIPILIWLFR